MTMEAADRRLRDGCRTWIHICDTCKVVILWLWL